MGEVRVMDNGRREAKKGRGVDEINWTRDKGENV